MQAGCQGSVRCSENVHCMLMSVCSVRQAVRSVFVPGWLLCLRGHACSCQCAVSGSLSCQCKGHWKCSLLAILTTMQYTSITTMQYTWLLPPSTDAALCQAGLLAASITVVCSSKSGLQVIQRITTQTTDTVAALGNLCL